MTEDKSRPATSLAGIDMKLEVVVIPVSDVERAKVFYQSLRWRLDATLSGVVQFTPPGSGCSVQFGGNRTTAAPGSAQGLWLSVSDLQLALDRMAAAGIKVNEVYHIGANGKTRSLDLSGTAIARSPRSRTLTATAGCCKKSRPGFPDASTLRSLRSAPQLTWRAPYDVQQQPMGSTKNAPASGTRTGPNGTPSI
jgi:catechol 2,3-dioxygenase-like lactoylglutathione lyase family enzyme